MKPSNAEISKKIKECTPIFQGARRSDIAMQIRCKMAERGLRNVDIAARLGVSEANVSRWLRGNQNLSLDTLYQLSDAVEEPLNIVVGTLDVCASGSTSNEDVHIDYSIETTSAPGNAGCGAPTDRAALGGGNVIELSVYAKMRAQIPSIQPSSFALARSESGVGFGEFEELKVK